VRRRRRRLSLTFRLSGASLQRSHRGLVALHAEDTGVDLLKATAAGRLSWRLAGKSAAEPEGNDNGISTAPLLFVDAENSAQRIGVSGTWRTDGTGALRLPETTSLGRSSARQISLRHAAERSTSMHALRSTRRAAAQRIDRRRTGTRAEMTYDLASASTMLTRPPTSTCDSIRRPRPG
jgi:hypothetical protein